MSTSIKDGGPAFPRAGFLSEIKTPEQVIAQYENKPQQGMTLRDYFAGQALAGIVMNYTTQKFGASEFTVAAAAYQYADAMLAAMEASK